MAASWSRINTVLLLILLVAGIAVFATRAEGGPLDPQGPPGPTLPQVEARSPIPPVGWNGTFPITISQSGSYVFTRSLTATSGGVNGIQITAPDVSIDMNGFTLAGFNKTGDGFGVTGLLGGITISNGVVRNWEFGIGGWDSAPPSQMVFSRVSGISALDNSIGISLGWDSAITNCNASQNQTGVYTHFSTVRACEVTDNAFYGIFAADRSVIEGNRVFNNGHGISVITVATGGGTVIRSNTAIHNLGFDVATTGSAMLLDNVVTCFAKLSLSATTSNVNSWTLQTCP